MSNLKSFGDLYKYVKATATSASGGIPVHDKSAKAVAAGLKNLRMGDLIEIPLEDRLEKRIINDK